MGRTARFEQIYVASLEAEPVESETLTGVNSILTREIEANEIKLVASDGIKGRLALANNTPVKQFSVGNKLFIDKDDSIVFNLQGQGNAQRFYAENQLAVGTKTPTNAFQINDGASQKVIVDLTGRDLMTVNGNLVATNVIIDDKLTFGSNLVIDGLASNIITVNGGMKTSNLSVGSNVIISDAGYGSSEYPNNVAVLTGNVTIDGGMYLYGNTRMYGNLYVKETATYERIINLVVADTTINFGQGNDGTNDPTLLFTHDQDESNVALGFRIGDRGREMALFQTTGGPLDSTFTVDDSLSTNLHIFGDIYTSNNVGVANTYPVHNLCVGSNLFVEDTGSNVLEVHGNTYTQKLKVGNGGISVGNLLTMSPGVEAPVVINSNVQMNALRTTGTDPSGISNLAPKDTLSIGAKIYVNLTAANTLTIFGNTMTTNLITQSISSTSNITVHADRYGGDSLVNPLILKSGPTSSNVSSIDIYGASTSNTHQNIRFTTKNREQMRISSSGNIGINHTNPSQKLTVCGNVHTQGSNVLMLGNTWGTTANTSMQIFSDPIVGENKVQNIVGSGKGLNFYTSTTPVMGTPKLVLLESSNVGINVTNPIGRLHTSGGSVLINDQVTRRGTYVHQETPMVITNTHPIVSTTDMGRVLDLTREGDGIEHGVRASFKLGKHETADGTSRSRLDLYLASDNYQTDADVMTFLSSGKVGIGSTQPSAYLEVIGSGFADPQENGILLHNHDDGDAIVAVETKLNVGNAFTSYILEDGGALTGWSAGVTNSDDFRITENYRRVLDPSATALFISSAQRDVGIGTDVPRGKLEVAGNVVIGNQLSFSGVTGQEFGNTHIIERRYTAAQPRSELVLFKGNNSGSVDQGPDRIRHIAAEHVFQTYNSSGDALYGDNEILATMDGQTNKPLTITDLGNPGIVVIGGNRDTAKNRESGTRLVVNGDIEFDGGGSFKLSGLEFSTSDLGYNIIRNVLDGATRRPLTFVHELDSLTDTEFARFDENGRLGLGTSSPTSNIHVYDTTPGDVDIMKLQSIGEDKSVNIQIRTNDGEGGFISGFSNVDNSTTGLSLGVANNSIITTCLNLVNTSNVGIGTPSPARQLHVVDHRNALLGGTAVMRVESITSNASIELTTTGGSSNIYSDKTGNVYIQPSSPDEPVTFVKSDLSITGALEVGGIIDFNTIGVGLSGATPSTDLEIGGGSILGSNEVSRKTYSKTFTVTSGNAKNIQLMFGKGSFYARVTAILRRIDAAEVGDPVGGTVKDINTMVLDLQGGNGDESQPSLDIEEGGLTLFGGTNSFPWDPIVEYGQRGVTLTPYNVDVERVYAYDIFVELTTACGGKLEKITRDFKVAGNLDNGLGGQTEITSFDY
jgi:hypothetical protein